ncbi:hypothetical protein PHYC_03596 [Phycisphaerales bacterium]|nr:hypothetical protein PHYC_03596 [Phycisphaerales bacterium]
MEPGSPTGQVTELLSRLHRGDQAATNELFPLVYEELKQLAQRHLTDERRAHTLSPTALVHEAYLRLVGPADAPWDSRAHFFGAAAQAIRRILTDHARTRNRAKRGGGIRPISLDTASPVAEGQSPDVDFEALDAALVKLAEIDSQKARVVELRFFGGLPVESVAAALGVSESTVARDWAFARVWLHRELTKGDVA